MNTWLKGASSLALVVAASPLLSAQWPPYPGGPPTPENAPAPKMADGKPDLSGAWRKGNVANWEIEMGSPAGLLRLGWTRNSLKLGEVVEVTGFLAKDGSNLANSTTVMLNGKRLFSGLSSESGGNPSPNP